MTQAHTFSDIQQTLTQATERATDLANAFKAKPHLGAQAASPNQTSTKAATQFASGASSKELADTVTDVMTDALTKTVPQTSNKAVNKTSNEALTATDVTSKNLTKAANASSLFAKPQAPQIIALHALVNHLAEAMFVTDETGFIQLINPEAAKLFGMPKDKLVGKKLTDFLSTNFVEEYQHLFDAWGKTDETELSHGPKEVLLKPTNGLTLEVDLSLSCLPVDENKSHALFVGVMHNLSSHKAEYKELRRLARTDCLTQLANRHAFDEVLQRSWNECVNHGQPLSLVIIDVDYFKLFNDDHGHVQGDECLRRIAQVIQSALPSRHCLAARYGGEEFALVLPGCNAHTAQATAARIQQQINRLSFTPQGLDASVRISVSQGIACERTGQFRTPTALLCAADTALYRAKTDGRDRINLSQ